MWVAHGIGINTRVQCQSRPIFPPLLFPSRLTQRSTESYLYRYSWDPEDLSSYPWDTHYVYQPQVLSYLQHVAKRHDLYKNIHFETALTGAQWNESSSKWTVQTSTGVNFTTRYLITSLGLLSKQNFPDIAGIGSFEGEKYHTGAWPAGVELKDKRVGIIGNGSTGVQVITTIAKDVKRLVSFQRNPQFSVPSGQGPVSKEYRDHINANYQQIWKDVKDNSAFGFGLDESTKPTFSVSPEEREAIFEKAWKKGGGFRFMFETFNDIAEDESANNEAANFIKRKIKETVHDQDKARKLLPTQLYARRPLCDAGYYEQFNRDNVDIVSLHDTPIERITPKGVKTSDGVEHEVDVLIFATGFDAVDGNYTRLAIQGIDGQTLKDHWVHGPTTYLGISVPKFPNMFMICGPNGPFCNIPPAIETHVEVISDLIRSAEEQGQQPIEKPPASTNLRHDSFVNDASPRFSGSLSGKTPVIEATTNAEQGWTKVCDEASASSLFRRTDSWIFGSNVKGKAHAVMFYFGGLAAYRKQLREVAENGWRGFTIR
jgi:cyclohexanone monooxygenase